MSDWQPVTVALSDGGLGDVDDVVARLRSAGMRVDEVLHPVGVVVGAVDPAQVQVLAGLAGVAAVERQHSMRTPDPESEIQ